MVIKMPRCVGVQRVLGHIFPFSPTFWAPMRVLCLQTRLDFRTEIAARRLLPYGITFAPHTLAYHATIVSVMGRLLGAFRTVLFRSLVQWNAQLIPFRIIALW